MDLHAWGVALTVILIFAAAALPLWGLWGLWQVAITEARVLATAERGPEVAEDQASYGEAIALIPLVATAYKGRPDAVRKDFRFIGGGILAGTAANLISLFL